MDFFFFDSDFSAYLWLGAWLVLVIGLYAWRIIGTLIQIRLAEHRLREQLARHAAAMRQG